MRLGAWDQGLLMSASRYTPERITVSAAQAARKLGFGKAKTLKLIHEGRLPAKQLDGRLRVRLVDIDAFLASLPDATTTQSKEEEDTVR